MASQRTNISGLDLIIKQALDDYSNDVAEAVAEAVETTGKKALSAVKEKSPVKTGKYKKAWKSKKEVSGVDKRSVSVTVYNDKYPYRTHLLENGHQKVNGGRVEGIPHIRPAEEEAQELLPKLIQQAIEEAGG